MDLKTVIGTVPDFPKPGIIFRDIMPLLADPIARQFATGEAVKKWAGKVDVVVALDARGFCFGPGIANDLHLPFVMVRKKGKLPGKVIRVEYSLEYRDEDEIELQEEAAQKYIEGKRVLVVDDVLATGGTAAAACELMEKTGGIVAGCVFIIELAGLKGRDNLKGREIQSLAIYD